MFRFITTFVLLLAAIRASAADVDYARDIKPILKERCYSCHGALKQNGRIRVDTVQAMLHGGKAGAIIKLQGAP